MKLNRLSQEVEKKDIDDLFIHGLTSKNFNNSAPTKILNILKISRINIQLLIYHNLDIYHEDVIWNKEKQNDVKKYNLKVRNKSFFQQLYKKEGWRSIMKHKCFKGNKNNHHLHDPSPRTNILIMTDGTPHALFHNGNLASLHMTLDYANDKILYGYFMSTE